VNRNIFVRLTFAAVCLALSVACLDAGTVIYSNLGPGNSYLADSAWDVTGPSSGDGFQSMAAPFTPSSNYSLAQIDAALVSFGGPNTITLSLNADSGGAPGAVIESWVINGLPASGASGSPVQTVTPVSTVLLNAGTQYWVVALATGVANDGWDESNLGAGGQEAVQSSTAGGWLVESYGQPPAFDVQGNLPSQLPSQTPEPATWVLAAAGLLAAGLLRRRD
jgi:MYXO-CTERM domain-containing protein